MNTKLLAQARLAGPILVGVGADGKPPRDIQFMPPGRQTIAPLVEGKIMEMEVNVGPHYAAAFQECLEALQASARDGAGDLPFTDFNHEDGRASGHPQKFYWGGEDPKKGGVRLINEWTGSGEESLINRDFLRFSPQWLFHKDTKEPIGMEVNMGGLVNKAAFKTISPVMASGKSVAVTAAFSETKTESNKMTKEEVSQIFADALKPIGDRLTALETKAGGATAAASGAGNIITLDQVKTALKDGITAELKPLSEKITAIEQNGVKASAKAAVQVHINRGAVPPGDAATIEFWEKAYIADAKSAEAQLAKIPGKANTRIINGRAHDSVATNSAEPEHAFMAKAKEYATTHKITSEAEAIAKYADTVEGAEFYKEFRNKIASTR